MKGTELFKEKFGPDYCDRKKYERMVNMLGIVDDVTNHYVPHGSFMKNTGFDGFRELSEIWNTSLFDHVRLYKYYSLKSFAVSQPYSSVETALNEFAANPLFVAHCLLHNYDITIYNDNFINWWADNTIVIVFKHTCNLSVTHFYNYNKPVYLKIKVVNPDHSVTMYRVGGSLTRGLTNPAV